MEEEEKASIIPPEKLKIDNANVLYMGCKKKSSCEVSPEVTACWCLAMCVASPCAGDTTGPGLDSMSPAHKCRREVTVGGSYERELAEVG